MAIPDVKKVDQSAVETDLQKKIDPKLEALLNQSADFANAYFAQYPAQKAAWEKRNAADAAKYQTETANRKTPQEIAPTAFTPNAPLGKGASIKAFYQSYIDKMNNAKSKDEIKNIQAAFKPDFDMAGLTPQESADIKLMQGALNKAATTNVSRVAAGKPPVAPGASGTQTVQTQVMSGSNKAPAASNSPNVNDEFNQRTGNNAAKQMKTSKQIYDENYNKAMEAASPADQEFNKKMLSGMSQAQKENWAKEQASLADYNASRKSTTTSGQDALKSAAKAPVLGAGTTAPESPVMTTNGIGTANAPSGEKFTMTDANGKVTTGNAADFGNQGTGARIGIAGNGYLFENNVNTTTGEPSIGNPVIGNAVGHAPSDEAFQASGFVKDKNGNWTKGNMVFNANNNTYESVGTVGDTAGAGTVSNTNTNTNSGFSSTPVMGDTSNTPQENRSTLDYLAPVTAFDNPGAIQLTKPGEETDLMNLNKQLLKTNPAIDAINNSMTQSQAALNNLKDYSGGVGKASELAFNGGTDAEKATSGYLAGKMNAGVDPQTQQLVDQMRAQANQTADEKYYSDLNKQRAMTGDNGDYRNAWYEQTAAPLRREAARIQEGNASDLASRGLGASTIVNDVNSGVQRDLTGNLTDLSNKAMTASEEMRQKIISDAINQGQTGNLNLGNRANTALSNAGTTLGNEMQRLDTTGLKAADQQRALQNELQTRGGTLAETAGNIGDKYTNTQLSGAKNQAGLATAKMALNQQIMDNIQNLADSQQNRDLTNINLGISEWDKRSARMWDLMNMPQTLYAGQNPLMQANAGLTSSAYQARLQSEAQKNANKANLAGNGLTAALNFFSKGGL